MIFMALILILLIFTVNNCMIPSEEVRGSIDHLSPVKLWLFIDEGVFSLLDDIDDQEM